MTCEQRRANAERLAAKWGVFTDSLDGEHLVLALEEAMVAGEDDALEPVRALLAKWERNRADPRYGQGAPGPLYVCGMTAEADCMIAGLREALASQSKPSGSGA